MSDKANSKSSKEQVARPGWGHEAGFLDLGDGSIAKDSRALSDRALIRERLYRYCWGFDEQRLARLESCFTEDAVWEGNVAGRIPIGPFAGRQRIVHWLTEFWPHQREQRRHMIMNTIVEQQSREEALTLSYILLMGATPSDAAVNTTGFYRLNLRREGDVWRIRHLFAGFDAPFWPGKLEELSAPGKARHGVFTRQS